jgi:hypothetical protein
VIKVPFLECSLQKSPHFQRRQVQVQRFKQHNGMGLDLRNLMLSYHCLFVESFSDPSTQHNGMGLDSQQLHKPWMEQGK